MISRRVLIRGAAAVSLPLPVFATEEANITDIVEDMAFSLADALDSFQGGGFCAVVFPASRNSYPVSYHRIGNSRFDVERYGRMMSTVLGSFPEPKPALVSIFPPTEKDQVKLIFRD